MKTMASVCGLQTLCDVTLFASKVIPLVLLAYFNAVEPMDVTLDNFGRTKCLLFEFFKMYVTKKCCKYFYDK